MSLFKFGDTNYVTVPNHPDIVASADTYNGYQFKLVGDVATPHATEDEVKAGDAYIMANIIDKPEILNTDDYHVKIDGKIRGYRLKDLMGFKLEMSADLITDDYGTVNEGDKIVGRSVADSSDDMAWKVAADVTGFSVYLEVVSKSTFGSFTIDKNGGNVRGGYVLRVMSA